MSILKEIVESRLVTFVFEQQELGIKIEQCTMRKINLENEYEEKKKLIEKLKIELDNLSDIL